jgi:hypothetical protein
MPMLIKTDIISDDLSSVQVYEHAGWPPIDSTDKKRMLLLVECLTESDIYNSDKLYCMWGCAKPQNIDLEG